MNELRQSAILISLIEHLRANNSWGGETHVQKTTYFLQELLGVPLNFNFIIYKYGPYSFELKDTIVSMRSDSLLDLTPNHPYGATLRTGELSEQVKKRFPRTLKQYEPQIAFVADKLGGKTVSELEAISTILFLQRNEEMSSKRRLVDRLQVLKPHIKDDVADRAIDELEELVAAAKLIAG